jgi:hypothetical protein
MRLTNPKFDAQMERHDHRIDLQRLGICNGNCNQGRQCDCVPDIPQMWDVEKELFASLNKWVRTVGLRTLGLVALGLTVVAVCAGMVRVAGWA